MCGRYAAASSRDELVEMLGVDADETDGALGADYNVAPTKQAPVVLERVPRASHGGDGNTRQLRMLTWGLVPSWSRDRSGAARMINARAETLFDKPAFRAAATARRALVPATAYYEWQRTGIGRTVRKQPFAINRADGAPLTLAGLFELWRDPTRPDGADAWLVTFTIVTRPALGAMGSLHDRQPVVIDPDRWDQWLDPATTDAGTVRSLLDAPPPALVAWPVSTAVGSVVNNGPQLLEAVPSEPDICMGTG